MHTITSNTIPLEERVAALAQLGRVMMAVSGGASWPGHSIGLNEAEYHALDRVVRGARQFNGWFTEENVRHAFGAWGVALRESSLRTWLAAYPDLQQGRTKARTVGAVLAGNVPLVGLHDVLCIWLSGHEARVKTSAQEPELMPHLIATLERFAPQSIGQVVFVPDKLGPVDAVIATGSTNTARYFEHYFGHLPRIVRQTRVSVAVLDGAEEEADLQALGEDVFRYFGLGCRNVSKVFVPSDFQLDRLFEALYAWHPIAQHNKYGNNYEYTRALWLLDGVTFLDNGFLLLKEDEAMASPVATLFFERYSDRAALDLRLSGVVQAIQCIVSRRDVPFGRAQHPGLADYADGADTMAFLLALG
jgi:hypothetical protein